MHVLHDCRGSATHPSLRVCDGNQDSHLVPAGHICILDSQIFYSGTFERNKQTDTCIVHVIRITTRPVDLYVADGVTLPVQRAAKSFRRIHHAVIGPHVHFTYLIPDRFPSGTIICSFTGVGVVARC